MKANKIKYLISYNLFFQFKNLNLLFYILFIINNKNFFNN